MPEGRPKGRPHAIRDRRRGSITSPFFWGILSSSPVLEAWPILSREIPWLLTRESIVAPDAAASVMGDRCIVDFLDFQIGQIPDNVNHGRELIPGCLYKFDIRVTRQHFLYVGFFAP